MARANVKVTFLCPIEKVWDTVTNLYQYKWRSDIENIQVIDEQTFIEVSKEGIETKFTVIHKKEFELWEFILDNKNIKGRWIGKFYRHGEKTTLDFTEEVHVKKIFMTPFVGRYLRKQQRQYFVDLKRELECEEVSKVPIF